MSARLVLMSEEEMATFRDAQLEPYIADRIGAGESAEVARATAEEQMAGLFPGGRPTPGHLIFHVVDDEGDVCGSLWIGPRDLAQPELMWIWDIEIDEQHRGRGLGRQAMDLAEEEARRRGASEIGLNVFGQNHVARGLYGSLGYIESSILMRKTL